jgi:hypothetical protein
MSRAPERPEGQTAGSLILIGRKEYVAFPDWNLWRVRAKVDTGAYSSALGVADFELSEGPGGLRVRFRPPRRRARPQTNRIIEAAVLKMVSVRSSSGCREQRPLIEAQVYLGSLVRRIRLTITNRAAMRCPMLLGRQALAGAFLVDVGTKYLLGTGRPA